MARSRRSNRWPGHLVRAFRAPVGGGKAWLKPFRARSGPGGIDGLELGAAAVGLLEAIVEDFLEPGGVLGDPVPEALAQVRAPLRGKRFVRGRRGATGARSGYVSLDAGRTRSSADEGRAGFLAEPAGKPARERGRA